MNKKKLYELLPGGKDGCKTSAEKIWNKKCT